MALSDFLVSLLTFVTVYSLFGLGLNVKYGFTGLIDFGHVAYFMVGAYVTAVLTLPPDATGYAGLGGFDLPGVVAGLGVPLGEPIGWLLGLALGMVAAALVSLAVGIPTLRLREDYLAITALGVATILNAVFHNEEWLFNGPFGIQGVHRPFAGLFPVSPLPFYGNLVLFGLPGLAALAYLGYRTARVVRPVGGRAALAGTGAVLAVAGAAASTVAVSGLLGTVGALAALAVGAALGWYALRVTAHPGPLLALAASEVFALWYLVVPLATGGVTDLVLNLLWLFDPNAGAAGGLDYDRFYFLLTLAVLAGGYWWVERTVNSPYGRVLRAIREDETVPETLGKPTFRYKIQSLMFGSALAGAAGGLITVQYGFIDTTQFAATVTFFAYTAVIVGGTANNRGVILGTAVFWVINSGTRFLDDFFPPQYAIQLAAARLMLIGALLVVILYYRPEGILGEQDYRFDLGEIPSDSGTDAAPEVTTDD